jgi:uncharacterized protein (TIGR03435 family)
VLGQADQKPLTFEVASIKPNDSVNLPQNFELQPGGRITITNVPVFQLIRGAYSHDGIQVSDQIVGGPPWIRSERYDIVAKVGGNLQPEELASAFPSMFRALMESRFHVRTHTEQRVMSVDLLVFANKDHKLGPRMHPSLLDCRGVISTASAPADATRWCGARGSATGHREMQGITMPEMTTVFASYWDVGRPVLNRTGLTGRWDAKLDYVPTFVAGPNADAAPVPNPSADSGPNMFSALRDELGLKLQGTKAPVDVIVIDHVERPAPD